MLGFKGFILEANLGLHPENYPEGSRVVLSKTPSSEQIYKGKLGSYKSGDVFGTVKISTKPTNYDYDLVRTTSVTDLLFITLNDSDGKQFTIRLPKGSANRIFTKGDVKGVAKLFANKELTPDKFGLSGKTLTGLEIISHIKSNLNYSKEINDELLQLAVKSNRKGLLISDIDLTHIQSVDLKTISKDYGEILGAIWAMKNLGFNSVKFPDTSNEQLLDFYANKNGEPPLAFSIKSGSGSKTSIDNIIQSARANIPFGGGRFEDYLNPEEEKAIEVLKTINTLSMRNGMIEAHKILETEGIKELAKAMNISVDSITNDAIDSWLNRKTLPEIKTELQSFYSSIRSKPDEKMWSETRDKNRLVIGPLGQSLPPLFNKENSPMLSVLNKIATIIIMHQLNVNVTKKSLSFKVSEFKDAKFVFDWQGYSGGGKLGFRMV